MSKADAYRQQLLATDEEWDELLRRESGLPGPRGNLELAQVVAGLGTPALFLRYAALDATRAPVNTPDEFLAFCGVLGLGRLLVEGDLTMLDRLRHHANDSRWRIREAVAMALQSYGGPAMQRLVEALQPWCEGTWLEQRAAAAALCEPVLLQDGATTTAVLEMLDRITRQITQAPNRRSDEFRALRKGLGYCWSVAVVAHPAAGKPLMEKWARARDPDVRWIISENLKKQRLSRMDKAWVEALQQQLRAPAADVGQRSVGDQ
ncbi:MAG: hypothetical protein H3C34_05905 [Caldilineaceae bacterium]|nr:hypothetical protein [Caldilineaceae bacterium]